MYAQEKTKKPRNTAMIMDLIHIVIALIVVVLAVLSFLNPEGNMLLFPVIFFLAAVLNIVNGIFRFVHRGHERKKRTAGIPGIAAGILLLALTVISAVSIWWG